MKLLNFRHFNTNSKKILWNSKFFFSERSKQGSKNANIILFSISRSFRPFCDNLFQKATEDRGPSIAEVVLRTLQTLIL